MLSPKNAELSSFQVQKWLLLLIIIVYVLDAADGKYAHILITYYTF